ncbi:MAG TPA: ABC transporter permease [Gammaproteobacteria bacterium]|nr:ABC transporter permease [Gammaproteobacteria bacterium]
MFRLAWKHLTCDVLRTAMTAVALASVIAVILVLDGFEQGQYRQLQKVIAERHADLFAAQAGVSNFVAARSSLPQLSREAVESVAGVVNAHPLTALPIIYKQEGKLTPVYILVYDTRGGPGEILAGNNIRDGRDIVIDQTLAKRYGLGIGDTFVVSDFDFRVSGITDEAAFFMPFAFVNYDGMIDLFLESQIAPDLSTFPLLSFLLIELEPGADRKAVQAAIEKGVREVDVFTPEELAAQDVGMARTFYRPIMGLLASVAWVMGLLVVGLILYADVRGRRRNFAVMKALGFRHRHLVTVVLAQSLLLMLLAIPAGLLIAQGTAAYIHSVAPVYLIRIYEPAIFFRTILASLFLALLGALIPLRSVWRSDPMLAFQET